MNTVSRLNAFDAFFETVHESIVANVITPVEGTKILDVGCGAGGMSVLLARSASVVALDPESLHLRATRDRARHTGVDQRIICLLGNVEKLQFIASEFDIVWCSRVIHHHLPDMRPALSEMYRVLKAGARLFLRESNNNDFMTVNVGSEGLWQRLGLAQQQWFQNKFRHRRPANDDWLAAMKAAGFVECRCISVSYTPSDIQAQLAYIRGWLEGLLEDDQSPEYGDVLRTGDRVEISRLMQQLDGVTNLDVGVSTQIYVGTK